MEKDALFYGKAAIETLMRRFKAEDLPPIGGHHYHQGVCLSGTYQIYLQSGEEHYFQYMKDWVDSVIDDNGKIKKYRPNALDDLQPGILLYPLYECTGALKYKTALDTIMENIKEYKVNKAGGFWHLDYCANQMWLDGLYMGGPIMAEYARRFNKPELLEQSIHQILLMRKNTRDENTKLWYHAWAQDRDTEWADPETGRSAEFWGRSMGWVLIAILDVLEQMEESHPSYQKLVFIFKELLDAICKYQSDEGRWYQVVNKGHMAGNWLENSCSCLYTAAICRAVKKGMIHSSYLIQAQKGYEGVINSLTWNGEDLLIGAICIGTGVGDYGYYCNRPTTVNDLHGIGAFLLMCAAVQSTFFNK